MHRAIEEYLNDKNRSDNPVFDFLGYERTSYRQKRVEDIKGNIKLMIYLRTRYTRNTSAIIQSINKCIDEKIKTKYHILYPIESVLQRFINLNESIELIIFLGNLTSANKGNNENYMSLTSKIHNNKSFESARDVKYGFFDQKNTIHHIIDLKGKYIFNEDNKLIKIVDEPIINSFDYFIDQWESELKTLMES